MTAHADANCIFCKIIRGDMPSFKLVDTDKTCAFLDIGPLSCGHALIVPKYHGEKLTDIPDECLIEVLKYCKAIAAAGGHKDYNILQSNGKLAYQTVPHVHFHVIPKTSKEDGLRLEGTVLAADMDELRKYCEELKPKL